MLGNRIILTPDRCYRLSGYLGTGVSAYPGTILQFDPTQAMKGNRMALIIYDRAADGDRFAGPGLVLCEDIKQGKSVVDSFSAGDFVEVAVPLPGCELNLLYKNVSGTADDVAAGNLFIVDDGTGKVIVTTGSPQHECAMALEALVDPVADALIHSIWGGN